MIRRASNPPVPLSSETARVSSDLMPAESAGGLSASMTSGGLEITDKRLMPFWALITGQQSGTNQYSFTQIDDGDPDNDFGATLSADFAASGGTTEVNGCAYEINGRTDVPANSTKRFRVYPAGDLSFYVFDAGAAAGSGIFGQDAATPGGFMVWEDDTGQWAGEAKALSYRVIATQTSISFPSKGPTYNFLMTVPGSPLPTFSSVSMHTHYLQLVVSDFGRGAGLVFPEVGASDREMAFTMSGKGSNLYQNGAYLNNGNIIATRELFFLSDGTLSGFGDLRTYPEPGGSGDVVRKHLVIRNWMRHYTSAGVAGLTGTLKAGATSTEGIITNLGTLTSAYTVTNVTTDRSYDANATTLDEIADCLGTLIQDLQAKSILG